MISYCLLASHFITLGPKLIKRPCSMHHCSTVAFSGIFHLENSFHLVSFHFISLRFIYWHSSFSSRRKKQATTMPKIMHSSERKQERKKKERRERWEEGIWASLAITKAKWIKIMQMSHKINYESYTRRRQRWEKLSKLWKLCKREQKKNVFCCHSCCCCCIVLLNDDQRASQRLPRRRKPGRGGCGGKGVTAAVCASVTSECQRMVNNK